MLAKYVEHSDIVAAEAYRLIQARKILNAVRIEVIGKGVKTNYYHNLVVENPVKGDDDPEPQKEHCYVRYDTVCKNPLYQQQVVSSAKHQLTIWKQRFLAYKHLFPVAYDSVMRAGDEFGDANSDLDQ